jgi:ParB family chromosome partitioning protein
MLFCWTAERRGDISGLGLGLGLGDEERRRGLLVLMIPMVGSRTSRKDKTMKHAFETREIPLNALSLHPDNVRAQAAGAYSEAQVAPLAANIRECGLLQPLLVAPLADGSWGVLAGGRRLAALKLLAADKTAKGFSDKMAVACRVVPKAETANVTLSFSENALQLPMDALDRFEAFAAMREKDGADIATIARTFAIAERTVKEALRLGAIHPQIRQAHRDGKIDLEALKAFDAHPDATVQLAAYEALMASNTYGRLQAWQVRGHFQSRAMVRAGDALGTLVFADYRAAGGAITADLIEEDSILEDAALIDTCLRRILSDRAEEKRAALGLAWSDAMIRPSWDELRAYGRVYPSPKAEFTEEEAMSIAALSEKIEALQGSFDEAGSEEEQAAIEAEFEQLSEDLDAMQNGYGLMEAGVGGVIAAWDGSRIVFHEGMVKPSDMPAETGDKLGATMISGSGATQKPAPAGWSESLRADMATVRTRGIALALAQNPGLARDYADYLLCKPVFGSRYSSYDCATTIRLERAAPSFPVKEVTGSHKAIEDVIAEVHAGLALDWARLPEADGFAAFRGLPLAMRERLMAAAVAEALVPKLPGTMRDPIRRTVEAEALPRLRDVWTPDEAFLSRLTKPALITILTQDLAMADQAAVLASAKKSEVVTFLTGLFAAPFATLTEDQRQRVSDWCPAELATPEAPLLGQLADSGGEDEREEDGTDEDENEDPEQDEGTGELEAA